jgi:uncharacterized 2Fe-2S/4Fe-4S cluster protein (DUF4445 family)
MAVYTIDFEPVGVRGQGHDNESLLACAQQLGLGMSGVCGGLGTCHSCKVKVVSGTISEITSHEKEAFSSQELEEGWRLACQSYPLSDCKLSVPPESMTTSQRIQLEGLDIAIRPDPSVRSYQVELLPPPLNSLQADADRLVEALNQRYQLRCGRIDIDVLRGLSPQLRSWDWQCQAVIRDDEVIAIRPWTSRQLGLAVDLGTTKIASYLVDLNSGQTMASKGTMNPQISYGEDIISRISHATSFPEKATQLQKVVVEALNRLAGDLCAQVGAAAHDILEAVVVGNTAMHHLFLGLPVQQLALSPFLAAVSRPLDIKTRDLGLQIAPGAYVHLLPNIGGFVGADHVAMLLATDAWRSEGPVIALDIGTNTEVSFVKDGKITAVSCASGPTFEGGHIKHGMRAATGAIERIRITNKIVHCQTIDGAPPVGICGSGILDAVAQLYTAGIIDKGGRMKNNHPHVRGHEGEREFVLTNEQGQGKSFPVVITQHDIREVQLGKAAIRAGIQILLETHGCPEDQIQEVIIAGAFGSYIDIESAITIGLLPPLPKDRFRQVGNAAGMGAKLALVSVNKRMEAQTIASKVHYLELATVRNFNKTFLQASYIGRFQMPNGEREGMA